MKLSKEEAALIIWNFFKNSKIRKNFKKPNSDFLVKYPTFAVGNDPLLQTKKLIKPQKYFAVVGTGGLRNVFLAKELTSERLTLNPHIFIVDNSSDVHEFWNLTKKLFIKSKSCDDFFENYKNSELIKSNCFRKFSNLKNKNLFFNKLGIDSESYHNNEITNFFKNFFNDKEENFKWMKNSIVNRLILIRQSWISHETFKFIKNICDYHSYDVYCYPSNIAEFLNNDDDIKKFHENINYLNPKAVIETSGCHQTGVPHKVHHYIQGVHSLVLDTKVELNKKIKLIKIKEYLQNSMTTEFKQILFDKCKNLKDLCFVSSLRQSDFFSQQSTTTGKELKRLLNLNENYLLKLEIHPNGDSVRMRDIRNYALYEQKSNSNYFFNNQDKENIKEFSFSKDKQEPTLIFTNNLKRLTSNVTLAGTVAKNLDLSRV
ncbi:hypothetical protein [Piscirickettsia salmonis]|uniref:hypothetical protein n=2 Tax=Piscirickettsia salmonis TaxID=1238 RepID=UPI00030678C9|nr:hypothetical protein [Piscirickettsia salmonis]ERL60515.1 hypothetical protein K661_03163 [Piscirickettsia salmonis LF-89 = ATCC VR-1361]PEQ15127.1 hypothetical protein X973_14455 [Piscirickettsia salmonis]QGN78383.1 hypothetical protein Psal001_02623 [Piscirickettsia salmonis]QGN81966.1 hypothetical protein Psal002_02641 [Piscirickettsia salmonis]QGN83762.1 hypothetical protein Psal003_00791 [Piscirickettsia salmonis]